MHCNNFCCHVAILVIATQRSIELESCCYCRCHDDIVYCHTSRHCYSSELQQTATVATRYMATNHIVAIDYIVTHILHYNWSYGFRKKLVGCNRLCCHDIGSSNKTLMQCFVPWQLQVLQYDNKNCCNAPIASKVIATGCNKSSIIAILTCCNNIRPIATIFALLHHP